MILVSKPTRWKIDEHVEVIVRVCVIVMAAGLGAAAEAQAAGREAPDVLNGIAWDPDGDRIFVETSDKCVCNFFLYIYTTCALRSPANFGQNSTKFALSQPSRSRLRERVECAYPRSTYFVCNNCCRVLL